MSDNWVDDLGIEGLEKEEFLKVVDKLQEANAALKKRLEALGCRVTITGPYAERRTTLQNDEEGA